ncbi:MAG: hypothetical protein ACOY3Z_01095 [Thermodesulfobacteriota bacterium]
MTLLEILVAVVFLSLAYVAVLQSFSQSNAGIFRLARSRPAELARVLAFEGELRQAGAGGQSGPVGEVALEGRKFVLQKIHSEDGQLELLRLVKR